MSDIEFEKALIFVPHPDDGEFSCGGTMAKWTSEGKEVLLCVVTNGAAGSNDPAVEREWLIRTREEEQREAAAILGLQDVIFLGYEDGYVEDSHELRRDMIREIRRHKPDVVVAPDPTTYYFAQRYINHTDHRKVGEAFMAAITPGVTTVPLYRSELYDQGFEPHRPKVVLLTNSMNGDYYVDIGDHLDTKVKALRAHRSQMGEGEGLDDRVRFMGRLIGERSEGQGEFCEGFKAFFFDRPFLTDSEDQQSEQSQAR